MCVCVYVCDNDNPGICGSIFFVKVECMRVIIS